MKISFFISPSPCSFLLPSISPSLFWTNKGLEFFNNNNKNGFFTIISLDGNNHTVMTEICWWISLVNPFPQDVLGKYHKPIFLQFLGLSWVFRVPLPLTKSALGFALWLFHYSIASTGKCWQNAAPAPGHRGGLPLDLWVALPSRHLIHSKGGNRKPGLSK